MCSPNVPINGGRVQLVEVGTDYKNPIVGEVSCPLKTIEKTITPTPLVRAFFSKQNMKSLQSSLRRRIYEISKGEFLIGNQSDTDLVVVMRSIFCMMSRNVCGCSVDAQVVELNAEVLAYVVPDIYSRIQNYIGYRRDVDTSLNKKNEQAFNDRGVSTSGPGKKVLSYPIF